MKDYPHRPVPAVIESNFALAQKLLVRAGALTDDRLKSTGPRFLPDNATWALDAACRGYALDRDRNFTFDFLREALLSFSRAISHGAPFTMGETGRVLAAALVLQDRSAEQRLAVLSRERCVVVGVTEFEAGMLVHETMAALVLGNAGLAWSRCTAAAKALEDKDTPRAVRETLAPIALLQRAILARDQTALDAALVQCLDSHARQYENPRIRNAWSGLVDLQTLGHCRLALRAGLRPQAASVYLPLTWLEA